MFTARYGLALSIYNLRVFKGFFFFKVVKYLEIATCINLAGFFCKLS